MSDYIQHCFINRYKQMSFAIPHLIIFAQCVILSITVTDYIFVWKYTLRELICTELIFNFRIRIELEYFEELIFALKGFIKILQK